MKKKLIRITTTPRSYRTLLKGQLNFMSNHFDVIAISSDEEGLLKQMELREKVPVISVKLSRKITPFKDLKALYIMYKILRKQKPYIVHTHTPKAGLIGMMASYLARVPNRLHTVAGMPLMEAKGLKRVILNYVEKTTYKCATKIYPNSYGLLEFIKSHNFTDIKKLKVIANGSSNGIDTDYFDPSLYSLKDKIKKRIRY